MPRSTSEFKLVSLSPTEDLRRTLRSLKLRIGAAADDKFSAAFLAVDCMLPVSFVNTALL